MLSSLLSISLFAAGAAVQPGPAPPKARAALIQPLAATTVIVTATPATISFTATNPATTPLVPGIASPTAVSFNYNGTFLNAWNLTVGGNSPWFTGCPTVPISAVTVTCTSVTVAGINLGQSCSAPFALSTSPTRVGGGLEGGNLYTYAVNLTFTLADSWKYIATSGQTCSLTLTYNATLN